MAFVAITVCEKGVLRVDVLVFNQEEYPEAEEFHHAILPEISQLDRAVKEKFERSTE